MLRTWVTEGLELLEGADAVAVDSFNGTKLGQEAAWGYMKKSEAKKSGVLFLYWKEALDPADFDLVKKGWPKRQAMIATEVLGTIEHNLFSDVHNQIDSDWNDGEPYENNDPRSVWPADIRKWYATFLPKLKGAKVDVSDIIVSPKTGLPGFKVTMTPALGSLPKYTGKNMRPVT